MRIKIVIVDDHKITRDGLTALIERQSDMTVVGEAENGRDAVNLVQKFAPDIVIMDINMPDLNGIDATRQIRALSPATKVIALSMYSDKRYVEGMLRAGVSGYLVKSCAFDELVKAILSVTHQKAYLSPGIAKVVMKGYATRLTKTKDALIIDDKLSSREREVLQLIAEGHTSEQIATKLYISTKTVSTHRRNIMDKLKITNMAGLIKFAIREGLISM